METFQASPPNSLLVIGDSKEQRFPEVAARPITVGLGCIAVGTLMEFDGLTTVRILDADDPSPPETELAYDGVIDLPSGVLTISNTHLDIYAKRMVGSRAADVRIYANDRSEPDLISIRITAR